MCEVYKNVHKHIENRRDNEETSIENYKLGYICDYRLLNSTHTLLNLKMSVNSYAI